MWDEHVTAISSLSRPHEPAYEATTLHEVLVLHPRHEAFKNEKSLTAEAPFVLQAEIGIVLPTHRLAHYVGGSVS